MFGYLLKKSFFDGWDNLGTLIIINFMFGMVFFGSLFGSVMLFSNNVTILCLAFFVSCILISVFSFGINAFCFRWSKFEKGVLSEFFSSFNGNTGSIFIHSIMVFFATFILPYSVFLYFTSANFIGYLTSFLIAGFDFLLIFIVQFHYPVCYYYNLKGMNAITKSIVLAIDNLGYSFLIMIRTMLDFALTVISLSLIPGLCGISLSRMDTVRLLSKKYEKTNKKLEWKEILEDDINSTGKRTLRNMIFPWKE